MNNINVIELAKQYPYLTISVTASDLIEVVDYCVQTTRKELEQIIQDSATETYLSPKKAAELLEVNTSTLWRWQKQSYLKPIELGGKRRYRKSDIDKILKGGV